MAKKVLLVSVNLIKSTGNLESNVDENLLSKTILRTQEINLRPIIGKDLYETILNEVYLKSTQEGFVINELLTTLLNDYIQPYLIAATEANFIITNNYKYGNKGIIKLSDNSGTAITAEELEYNKNYYDNYVSTYKTELLNFLADNKLGSGTDTDTTTQSIGWYLNVDASPAFVNGKAEESLSNEGDPVWQAERTFYYKKNDIDATIADVNSNLASETSARQAEVTNLTNIKADKTYVDSNVSTINSNVSNEITARTNADNNLDSIKANKTDVATSLALKTDNTTFNSFVTNNTTALGLKANTTDVDNQFADVSSYLEKTQVVTSNVKNAADEFPESVSGDVIKDSNSQTDIQLVNDSISEYIVQQNDGGINSRYILSDYTYNGGRVFPAGTKWSAYINVDNITSNQASWLMGFDGPNGGIWIAKGAGDTYHFTLPGTPPPILVIKTVDGKVLASQSDLKIGTWYHIELTLTVDKSILDLSRIDTDHSRGINLTYSLWAGTIIKIANFVLRDEKFTIDPANKTMIGEKGSVFYRRPENDESVFGNIGYEVNNNIVFNDRKAYKILPKDFIVTPQMFGYVASDFKDNTNDASDYIQACFDSDYNVYIPAGYYYISKPVYVKKPKSIKLADSSVTLSIHNGTSIGGNNFSSILWSDTNISFVYFQSSNIDWEGGLIDTTSITLHDKAGIELDANFQVAYCNIRNLKIQGDINTVKTTGKGTKGIYTNLDVTAGTNGYAFANSFIDCFGLYIASVVEISNAGVNWMGNASNFVNSYEVDIKGDGCKEFVALRLGSTNKVKAFCQDRDILSDEEKGFAPFTVMGSMNTIDVFCYDQNYGGVSLTAPHRHVEKVLVAPGSRNMLTGRSLTTFTPSLARIDGLTQSNTDAPVNNPAEHYLANSDGGIISSLNNEIRYAGDLGMVSYKGYNAPNDAWFEANLNAANDLANTTVLTEDATACLVEYPEKLLSSNDSLPLLPRHMIKKTLGFAEVVITLPKTATLRSLKLSVGGSYGGTPPTGTLLHKKFQIICLTTSGLVSKMYLPDAITMGRGSFSLPYADGQISKIILRFIGANVLGTMLEIHDIAVLQLGTVMPAVIDISNRSQRKTGLLVLDKPVADNATIDGSKSYFAFSADVTNFDFLNYNSTIYVNNTNAVAKTINLEVAQSAGRGGEFTMVATDSAKMSMAVNSNPFYIAGNIIAKDGSYASLYMEKGDWVKLKRIDRGTAGNRTYSQYMVIERGYGVSTRTELSAYAKLTDALLIDPSTTETWTSALGKRGLKNIWSSVGSPTGGNCSGLSFPYSTNDTGAFGSQIAFRNNAFYFRSVESSVVQPWLKVADTTWVAANYLTPTGSGASLTGITPTQIGLGNVNNTSDANKPISIATQTALDLKANISSPTFTGTVTAPQYKVSALNTAPASATATGTLGEVRITAGYIYVCTATNTWVRSALTTW